ncbi:MAG: alpha/beta fold hydrolase, partial [Actinobacteria bacterium]|nr:alpha/beta fold hydrolase [Actinomycetota bacterium]
HAGRYEEFAEFLAGNGFTVYAADQRGHGKTAKNMEMLGHFADKNGWFTVVDDLKMLNGIIDKENPGADVFLFGHSAGSMLALDYILKYPENIKGAILSGISGNPGILGYAGIALAKPVIKKRGPAAKSPIHKKLLFEKYNSYFKPNRTSADWVSSDEKAVDKMLEDPYVFQLFSAAFYEDLARAALRLNRAENIKKLPGNLPFFIISGSNCAVGGFGKGVSGVYRSFLKAGLKDVSFKLYQGARHEIINEINKQEVFDDVLSWLDKKLNRPKSPKPRL